MRTLITDTVVVTNDAEARVLTDGALLIEGERIAEIGPSALLKARHAGVDRVIDGRGKLAMPGLVSAHTHVGYTVFRGRVEDSGMATFLTQLVPMAAVMTAEERLVIGELTYLELLKSGVTTVAQVEEHALGFPAIVERLGLRSFIGVMVQDVAPEQVIDGSFRPDPALCAAELAKATEFAEAWKGAQGLVRPLLMVNSTMTSSPALLDGIRRAADRLGCRLSIHLGIGTGESDVTRRLHGQGSFAYAAAHGLLAPDVLAAHCFHVTSEDIDILAASGASLAHCPQINAVRGLIAPAEALRARGVNVALGIDNYFADFFEVLRAAVIVARIKGEDGTVMPPAQVLRMATVNGARALGLDDLGVLAPGYRADVVLLDCRRSGLTPLLEPVPSIVYHAHGANVDTVLVEGSVVLEGGRPPRVDENAILDRAQATATAVWQRFIERYGGTRAKLAAA